MSATLPASRSRLGRWLLAAAGAALLAGSAPLAPPALAQGYDEPEDAVGRSGEVDPDEFQQQLERYGQWIEHPRWGYVWSPEVDTGWRPYTRGHWANTEEYGWFWVSEEPFGWAVYHYGRWTYDEGDGWLWIPGRTWAPAWVSWRHSDEYIGWAPLPPEAEWTPGRGLSAYSASYYDGAAAASLYWIFVRPHRMVEPGLWRHVEPASRAPLFIRETRFVHGFAPGERRVFNRGLDVRRFERIVGRPVPVARVRPVSSPGEHGFRGGERAGRGGDIPVFRPRIAPATIRPAQPGRPGVSILQPRPDAGSRPVGRPGVDRPRDERGQPGAPGARGGQPVRPLPSSGPATLPPNRPAIDRLRDRQPPERAPAPGETQPTPRPPRAQVPARPQPSVAQPERGGGETQPRQPPPQVLPRPQPPAPQSPGGQPRVQLPPVINQQRPAPSGGPPPQVQPRPQPAAPPAPSPRQTQPPAPQGERAKQPPGPRAPGDPNAPPR